tara:strand:+ start:35970 stop:36311 length:342 start_codon:yes stop_codon:yes gene_type:complete
MAIEIRHTYRDDGSLLRTTYHSRKSPGSPWERHREKGPAVLTFWASGMLRSVEYYREGKVHREDGPAVLKYYPSGKLRTEEYAQQGVLTPLHEGGPAFIDYNEEGTEIRTSKI